MKNTPYPKCVPNFIDEYSAIVDSLGSDLGDEALIGRLMANCEWTGRGSEILVMLARQYGTFILANALALAEALDIEDGEAGL
jgi:hypothetical protein